MVDSIYPRLIESRKFRLRLEADKWARVKKQEYKEIGESIKIDINFVGDTKEWKAMLYIYQKI